MTRTVFISGAAQGIGKSTAELLATHGWTVGAFDISDQFAWATNPSILTGHLDVTDPASWESALKDFAAQAGGHIDVVVNNAGILYGGPFVSEGSYKKDAGLVDVNIKGVLFGARAAYPWLRGRPDARLINMASAAAIYGTPDMAVYSATKFAVRGITEALDLEWDQDDIYVTDVLPLYAKTGMLDGVETSGTKKLGVKLSPQDIATAIAQVVEEDRKRPRRTHHPVGLQSKLLFLGSHFAPAWLTRFVNAKLTTDRRVRL